MILLISGGSSNKRAPVESTLIVVINCIANLGRLRFQGVWWGLLVGVVRVVQIKV